MKKNIKKFEFTFTHFLAILIILVFIILMFLSSILKKQDEIDKKIFIDDVKEIYNLVNNKDNTNIMKYSSIDNSISDEYKDYEYCILLNELGDISNIAIGNKKYYLLQDNVSDIKSVINEKIIYEEYPFTSCNSIIFSDGNNCTFNNGNNPNDGDIYRNGMFEYRYNYHLEIDDDSNYTPSVKWMKNDLYEGWGVSLVDRNSLYTENVSVCTSINNKPVVSMKHLFTSYMYESDFSNFDTRNVIDMSYMFYYYHGNQVLDLTSFNTRNVENMSYMFDRTAVKQLDMSSFIINNNTRLNGILTNNRLLTKVLVNNNSTKKLIEKNNSENDRLKIIVK